MTQYNLTILGGAGGSVSPGSQWVEAGSASVALDATPAPGYAFDNWTGAPYHGTDPSPAIPVTGPAHEVAAFSPIPSASTSTGLNPAFWALPVVLFVVGLVAVPLVSRRRRG